MKCEIPTHWKYTGRRPQGKGEGKRPEGGEEAKEERQEGVVVVVVVVVGGWKVSVLLTDVQQPTTL